MSTTSPNFNLVLATTSDTISVTSHISNNFLALDSLLSQAHTGTGQLKAGLQIATPTIVSPTLSGSAVGATFVSAGTGSFNTITATGGNLTVNALSVGTYGYPAAIGTTGHILTVVTGNAVWASNSPNTGATLALNNLASVAINTNMNTFTAGFVTVDRVIATSGALTGLTAFQASAGTFAGNVVISGTATINAVNCTGGSITAGGVTIGTFALPGTIASTGILRSLSSTATWYAPAMVAQTAFSFTSIQATALSTGGTVFMSYGTELYDLGSNAVTGAFTAPASGVYEFGFLMPLLKVAATQQAIVIGLQVNATQHTLFSLTSTAVDTSGLLAAKGVIIRAVSSGDVVKVYSTASGAVGGAFSVNATGDVGYFYGKRLFEL